MRLPTAAPARSRATSGAPGLSFAFLLVLVLVSMNLRAPFVAVAPVTGQLRADLGVGAVAIGILTSLPVLCFGLLAPFVPLVIRRTGPQLAITLCLVTVVIGAVLRSAASYPAVVAGTVVIGLGITIGNVGVPVVIRRTSPLHRVGAVTGLYVAAMNAGSMLCLLTTAPLTHRFGWRVVLAGWGLLALVGITAWQWYVRQDSGAAPAAVAAQPGTAGEGRDAAGVPEDARKPWRVPIAWLLALAFAGQSTSYYSLTAWLPSLLADETGLGRNAAGAASSIFQVCAIAGAFAVPVLSARMPSYAAIGLVGLAWMTFPALLLIDAHSYLIGSVVGGIAQGAGFSAIFTIVVQVSRSDRQSAQLSAFVQGTGYVVAATGPTVLGMAHDATGGWALPVLIVLVATATFTVSGVTAAVLQQRLSCRTPSPGRGLR